jgi:hypothetical protein
VLVTNSSLESKKRRLMSLVDLSAEPWRKVAFYSNEEAVSIVSELYKRWEEGGRRGTPLDYASEEELDRLIFIAERIEPVDISNQQVRILRAAIYGEEAAVNVPKRRSRVIEIIKRILLIGSY